MRFGWLVVLAAFMTSNGAAQSRLVHVDEDADGPNYDDGELISPALAALIRSGRVRKATAAEAARLQPVLQASQFRWVAGLPVFVLLKPVPTGTLVQFGGSYAVNLIVPPSLRRHDLELGAGSSFFSPAGLCLGGALCGRFASAPPAPPPQPRR